MQQLNSLSLQRSENVYSYERTRKDFAPLGAKPGRGNFAEAAKNDCAPKEPRNKEKRTRQAINISSLWGAATNNVLLHFQLEFLICNRKRIGIARMNST